jgi:hypothetical protein
MKRAKGSRAATVTKVGDKCMGISSNTPEKGTPKKATESDTY